jgi:phage tail protein X
MRSYTTGVLSEPLDLIARDQVGSETDMTAILALNPGLADGGLIVPPRTTIALPDRPERVVARPRRLFG